VNLAIAGLDLMDFAGNFSKFTGGDDAGRTAFAIREMVKPLQDSFTALEKVIHQKLYIYV